METLIVSSVCRTYEGVGGMVMTTVRASMSCTASALASSLDGLIRA